MFINEAYYEWWVLEPWSGDLRFDFSPQLQEKLWKQDEKIEYNETNSFQFGLYGGRLKNVEHVADNYCFNHSLLCVVWFMQQKPAPLLCPTLQPCLAFKKACDSSFSSSHSGECSSTLLRLVYPLEILQQESRKTSSTLVVAFSLWLSQILFRICSIFSLKIYHQIKYLVFTRTFYGLSHNPGVVFLEFSS